MDRNKLLLIIVGLFFLVAGIIFYIAVKKQSSYDQQGNLVVDQREYFDNANKEIGPTLIETKVKIVDADMTGAKYEKDMPYEPAFLVTDGIKHTVPLDKIVSGGPPMDGIPSIDNPKFESVSDANAYLDDNGLGLAVSLNGIDKFYPFQVLVWHEIVNDKIDNQSLLVTYCPLCGTGIVFDPEVNGKDLKFGTSGKLYQSNLVMYDRSTSSYWSQVMGESIVGELAGTKLKLLPHDNLTWGDWKKDHPQGLVLSRDTGYVRNYINSPYDGYINSKDLYFEVDNLDNSYHLKEPVWGLELADGQEVVFPLVELKMSVREFVYAVGKNEIKVNFNNQNNTVKFAYNSTNEEIIPVYGFWFSWRSVHPNSQVYQTSK